MADSQLMMQFARVQSSEAFAVIVRRYINLVYATARRMVGDAHQAEDVTQAAFLVLLKKARTVEPSTLPGWLVNTTRLVARDAIRSKRYRERHEVRAARMKAEMDRPRDEPTVEDLTPMLDDALSRLNASDRSAVVMRFLQGLSFADVGGAAGVSEDAARKRVGRAVDKLRTIFMKQGIAPSAGGLMVVLASQQASHAPAMLAGSVSAASASGGTGASLILAKGVMSAMTWAKIKVAAALFLIFMTTGALGVQAIRRVMAEEPAPVSAPTPQSNSLDLLERYPTQLTQGDEVPNRARPWEFTTADIFRVSRFSLTVGNELHVDIASCDLGIGHCADGAVWAVLIPRSGGILTSRNSGEEAISNVWLRFHPGEIDRLFPPNTVSADGATNMIDQMRAVARAKMVSSWQAGGRAMIPEPKDMTVDVDVKDGPRRFFVVDTLARTTQYMPVFEQRAVKAPPPRTQEVSIAAATEPLSDDELGYVALTGGLLCLLTVTGILVFLRFKARSR